jgi:hypothetical protein
MAMVIQKIFLGIATNEDDLIDLSWVGSDFAAIVARNARLLLATFLYVLTNSIGSKPKLKVLLYRRYLTLRIILSVFGFSIP